MAKKLYEEASVQAIANAIRAKNGRPNGRCRFGDRPATA